MEADALLHAQAKEVDLQDLQDLHQAQMVVVAAGLTQMGVVEAGLAQMGVVEAGLSRVGVTEAGLSRVGVTEAGLTRVQRAMIIMNPKYALT